MSINTFTSVGTSISGMSLSDATEKAGLDWTVNKLPVSATQSDGTVATTSRFFATVRNDTNAILGIVGPDYQVVQNQELAWLCERVQGSDVKIETAGSLSGGARVWYQMRGNPFDVGPEGDTNIPYCLVTNGHDGQWTMSVLPTTIRVICQNTLNMAVTSGRRNNMMISLKHNGNITHRLESLATAIEEFNSRTKTFKEAADILAYKPVTTEFVQQFWTQVYVDLFGKIHSNPVNEVQEEDNKSARKAMIKWSETFDLETKVSGANLWTAVNAVTNWLDHSQVYRGNRKHETRFVDTLFGDGAKEKVSVLTSALALV